MFGPLFIVICNMKNIYFLSPFIICFLCTITKCILIEMSFYFTLELISSTLHVFAKFTPRIIWKPIHCCFLLSIQCFRYEYVYSLHCLCSFYFEEHLSLCIFSLVQEFEIPFKKLVPYRAHAMLNITNMLMFMIMISQYIQLNAQSYFSSRTGKAYFFA